MFGYPMFNRRHFLQHLAGVSAMALPGFQFIQRVRAAAPELKKQGKSIIVLWMSGGPPTIDLWDLKPGEATAFDDKPIQTAVSGIDISPLLPKVAEQMNHLAIVRSLSTTEGDHNRGTTLMHTGRAPTPIVSYPSIGSMAAYRSREQNKDLDLPSFIAVNGGRGGAGFLGMNYAPFVLQNPGAPPENIHPPGSIGGGKKKVVDDFEAVLTRAVDLRLRADVPVVSYLSGGVDSSVVVALATHVRREPIPTFTIRIMTPRFDESAPATLVARHIGADPVVVNFNGGDVLNTYPALIRAAEGPVIDTSCAALLRLAREVHNRNYKVAVTGEGADEFMAGYPWFKIQKLVNYLDAIPGLPLSQPARRLFLKVTGSPEFPWSLAERVQKANVPSAWLDAYGMMSLAKLRFYSKEMMDLALAHVPYEDLQLNLDRARRWHPLNQSLYLGIRVMLPGLLLNAKGDRVAMNSSVETRYPFLDEDVLSYLSGLHPRWKMPGLRDKYVLRLLAERWVPKRIAWRAKAMFRAPFDCFHTDDVPPFVEQLLSEESLRKTGYFDPQAVRHWRKAFRGLREVSYARMSVEMGLVGVVATQLWHQLYIDNSLADLPSPTATAERNGAAAQERVAIESANRV